VLTLIASKRVIMTIYLLAGTSILRLVILWCFGVKNSNRCTNVPGGPRHLPATTQSIFKRTTAEYSVTIIVIIVLLLDSYPPSEALAGLSNDERRQRKIRASREVRKIK